MRSLIMVQVLAALLDSSIGAVCLDINDPGYSWYLMALTAVTCAVHARTSVLAVGGILLAHWVHLMFTGRPEHPFGMAGLTLFLTGPSILVGFTIGAIVGLPIDVFLRSEDNSETNNIA